MREANIRINGILLSDGQAMAVRMAVTSCQTEMSQPDVLGDDEYGRKMAKAYHDQLLYVWHLMEAK